MQTLVQPKPYVLAPQEGKQFSVLDSLFVTKATGKDTKGAWSLYKITDTAENGPPLHTHPWDEGFYILEGELEVQAGAEKFVVTIGHYVHIPGDTAHAFKVLTPTARFLVMLSPADATEFYEEMGRLVSTTPPDMEKFLPLAEKYGIRLLG